MTQTNQPPANPARFNQSDRAPRSARWYRSPFCSALESKLKREEIVQHYETCNRFDILFELHPHLGWEITELDGAATPSPAYVRLRDCICRR